MSLLTQPQEIKANVKFKGLIYGQPGIGKTTLALSAPNPVCIDSDRGMHRVEPHLRVPSLQVKNYEEILQLLNSDEIKPFETLVFDTIGEVLTLMEPYLIKNNPKNAKSNGTLSLAGYGDRKREFKELLKLAQNKGKSIVFVAHEKEEKEGDGKVIRPDIPGSSGADIVKMLDFVGYMEAIENKRTIAFSPTQKYYAKNSLKLDGFIEVPNTANGNTFIIEYIVKKTKERLEQQSELRKQYDEVIAKASEIVKQDDLNKALTDVSTLPVIWDSKQKTWHMLQSEAETKGLVYNKESKQFEIKVQDVA